MGDVSVFQALVTEAWGTAILAFVIFSLTHARNGVAATADKLKTTAAGGDVEEEKEQRSGGGGGGARLASEAAAYRPFVPLMIGATVSMLLALYAPITQAGWNPAVSFRLRWLVIYVYFNEENQLSEALS